MARTIQELAREALAVQDACNLSGVAHSFARAMSDLFDHVNGTDARNGHPIAVVWADKIAQLTGTQTLGNDRAMVAFDAVARIAEGEVVGPDWYEDRLAWRRAGGGR